jgi:hypothetical protein
MVKSILCLLQRSHVSWKPTNRVKVWDQWQLLFLNFSQVSALDVAWTILIVSQIFSYRQLVWQLISTFVISLTTADKFCSTQTHVLLQIDLPLHIHTMSCKKSDVMGPSKYFCIKYLFSFLHPYSKGDLGGGLASLACVHTYTWNATQSMCCLNAASDGGILFI